MGGKFSVRPRSPQKFKWQSMKVCCKVTTLPPVELQLTNYWALLVFDQ